MKIGFFSDPHNADIAPEMRTDDYCVDILKKQEFLVKAFKKCDLVVCGGDIFNSKNEKKISYGLSNKLLDIYREFKKCLIVVGNHDLYGGEQYDERPINLFAKLPNVRVAIHSVESYEDVDFLCFGGGEITFNKEQLHKFMQESTSKRKQEKRIGVTPIAVLHYPIAGATIGKVPYEIVNVDGYKKYAKWIMLGHLHDYQYCQDGIVAPGGLARGSLKADMSSDRPVYYAIVDTEKETSELVEVPVRPHNEVFRIDEKEHRNFISANVKDLASVIASMEVPKIQTKGGWIEFILALPDVSDDVKKSAVQILEGV